MPKKFSKCGKNYSAQPRQQDKDNETKRGGKEQPACLEPVPGAAASMPAVAIAGAAN